MVLGSGLGAFADELTARTEIPLHGDSPLACSTAVGHAGRLVFGRLGGLEIVVMAGRAHLYEGYTPEQVVFGVRVLGSLGVASIVFTNAAGGINLKLERGGLVLISDHINLQGSNPLTGPNDDWLGARFPDMSEAYSANFRAIAIQTARELGIELGEGVYAAMLGPSYETPAEIRYLAHHRRGCGRHVDGSRGHRRQSHGNPRARDFLRDEYGRRYPAAKDQSRRSARNRRDGPGYARAPAQNSVAAPGGVSWTP